MTFLGDPNSAEVRVNLEHLVSVRDLGATVCELLMVVGGMTRVRGSALKVVFRLSDEGEMDLREFARADNQGLMWVVPKHVMAARQAGKETEILLPNGAYYRFNGMLAESMANLADLEDDDAPDRG
jgi:hypothetical protein